MKMLDEVYVVLWLHFDRGLEKLGSWNFSFTNRFSLSIKDFRGKILFFISSIPFFHFFFRFLTEIFLVYVNEALIFVSMLNGLNSMKQTT